MLRTDGRTDGRQQENESCQYVGHTQHIQVTRAHPACTQQTADCGAAGRSYASSKGRRVPYMKSSAGSLTTAAAAAASHALLSLMNKQHSSATGTAVTNTTISTASPALLYLLCQAPHILARAQLHFRRTTRSPCCTLPTTTAAAVAGPSCSVVSPQRAVYIRDGGEE
jgi:hypothetical protein